MPEVLAAPRRAISGLRQRKMSSVAWLNLVCLDAPIVAITWQWLFARSFHISLTPWSRAALFLTAWLIYLADRLADTWTLTSVRSLSLRQEFGRRHQRAGVAAIAGVALIDLWIISHQLDRKTIQIGMLFGSISFVYLAINYWLGKTWRFLPVKEICIGSLFAFGTVAAFFSKITLGAAFIAPFILFATLCSLNCISIAAWECELDRAQHKDSIATRFSGIRSFLRPSVFVFGLFTIAIALGMKVAAPLYVCVATSAFLLGVLDSLGDRIPRDERTALADLVLLTPLFLLAFGIT